jgi:hypothetical protein
MMGKTPIFINFQARKTTNSFLLQTTKDASINELVAISSQPIQMGHYPIPGAVS